MELHNLNIRLLENRHVVWTCTSHQNPEMIHRELMDSRMSSGISQNCALVMAESLWLKWCSDKQARARHVLTNRSEWNHRGVLGVWKATSDDDKVILLCDYNVHKEDRFIGDMSYAFIHSTQVKYPRQFDSPSKKVAK